MKNKFAATIKELRTETGITQKQLADAVNVLERTVSYWEAGKRECDFDTLLLLANFFCTSTDYILGAREY